MTLKTLCIWGFALSLAVGVGTQLAIQANSQSSTDVAKVQQTRVRLPRASSQSVQAIARAITVKIVLPEGGQGSGIIVRKQKKRYTVLTNHHVLLQEKSVQVQTPDGNVYTAAVDSEANFQGKDLALIQFEVPQARYKVAEIAASDQLQPDDRVFAAGFPNDMEVPKGDGFKFTEGHVAFFTPKTMEGGYRLGYTNEIIKGMSGGPVLNQRGQVVAVNGMHAFPLWGDPYIYEDKSRPNASLQTQMVPLSWAIPIETALQFAPQALQRSK